MRINILTLFPEWFASPLDTALLGKARGAGILDVRVHDLRDATHDRHRTVDDTPAGGGAGMVLKADVGGLRANYLLMSQRTPNPFDMDVLRSFRLTEQL